MDIRTLLADPCWLAHRHVEGADAVRFVRLERADHGAVPFLSEEHLRDRPVGGDVALADCLALPGEPRSEGPLHFLFHSAFCGSTTLVRALDQPGLAMGLSEPQLLNDVVGLRRRGADPRLVARTADAATRLLARPFAPGEAVVVKPSNVINPLAALLLALRPAAQAVFLFAPLETYLISVARKGLHCRAWGRELLEGFLRDGELAGIGLEPDQLFRLTDLQVAATGWLLQHRMMHRLAARLGPQRVATLDADLMFAAPEAALARVAAHYGLPLGAERCRAIAAGPAFGTRVKSGEAYSPAARERDYAAVRSAYGEEIDMVLVWARAVAETAQIALAAPNPLLAPDQA